MTAMTRRGFLKAAAAAGMAAAVPRVLAQQEGPSKRDPLRLGTPAGAAGELVRVGILGAGDHGRHLLFHCNKLPGLQFRAACDIWPYARTYAAKLLQKYKHPAKEYGDYRDMLADAKELDAVIIATPDGFHAEQAVACLEAGLHVYCEKEMALTVEDCRRMVQAARKTGKLLQIGRQHRSNARYYKALEYIDGGKAVGRLTHVAGQWHGHKRDTIDWPEKQALDKAALARYGFESMEQFRNWRWFARFSAGPIASLGSHQLDVFNWFLHSAPKSVYAGGGLDYYGKYELYDNISCVYEWDYDQDGRKTTVRGTYEINSTTEVGGFFEKFTGTEGELIISEIASRGGLWREAPVPVADWEKELTPSGKDEYGHRAYAPIASPDDKNVYWCHLRNFFEAVRGREKLACPPELGFQAALTALRTNDAMRAGRRLEFRAEEFQV